MAHPIVRPTGVECPLGENELIVSKTNLKGQITYANDVFMRLAKFPYRDVIGAPHSLIRHPEMPRSIFKLLWDTIQAKRELFAFVVNMARDGDHYWVLAHVTPSLDEQGAVFGFHSNRRKAHPPQIAKIKGLYAELLAEESAPSNRKEGMQRGYELLMRKLGERGLEYDEFVFSL